MKINWIECQPFPITLTTIHFYGYFMFFRFSLSNIFSLQYHKYCIRNDIKIQTIKLDYTFEKLITYN